MALHPDELTDDLLLRPESRTNNSLISCRASAGHLDRNHIDGERVLPSAQARSAVTARSAGLDSADVVARG